MLNTFVYPLARGSHLTASTPDVSIKSSGISLQDRSDQLNRLRPSNNRLSNPIFFSFQFRVDFLSICKKGDLQRRLPLNWQIKKARSRPKKGAIVPKMFQTGQCSQGSTAILNRQNSGRDATINIFSLSHSRKHVNIFTLTA